MTETEQVLPPVDAVISFSAEINVNTTESLIALFAQAINSARQHLYLLLSTPGGSVMHGLNVYNIMRGLPFALTVHNVGNVDSIGNAIFLAGQRRWASPHSTFMFHGVAHMGGNSSLEQKQLREMLDAVEADQRRIAGIITERSDISETEASTLFLEARTQDAHYAVSKGIVHEIRDVELPASVPVQSLVFQR